MSRQAHHSKDWGGKREGAGHPKETKELSASYKTRLEKALKRVAKRYGFSDALEALAELALNPTYQDTVRASAWKIITEIYVVKTSHQTVETIQGPTIGLPPITERSKEDEARVH